MGKGDDEDAEFEGTDEEHAAAAKIQARHRGKKDRKKCKDLKEKKKVRPPTRAQEPHQRRILRLCPRGCLCTGRRIADAPAEF